MSLNPWINIEHDTNSGSPIIIVDEEHLRDFPKFMKAVLQKNIGQEVGFFKIRFRDGVKFATSLQEITEFIHSYYFPPQSRKRKEKNNVGTIRNQIFCLEGRKRQELFGYATSHHTFDTIPTTRAKEHFAKSASNCNTFQTQSTCCLQALKSGKDNLLRHYWEFMNRISYQSSKSADIQRLLYYASSARYKYEDIQPSDAQNSNKMSGCLPDQNNDSSVGDNLLLYGADIPLREKQFPLTSNFSLSKLRTILDEYPIETPGISYPYLYVGAAHATFPWHIEDHALFSINTLHFGAPCVWFFVPPKFYRKFVDWLHFVPLSRNHTPCRNILGHKHVVASEKFLEQLGIPVTTIIQQEKEIVVTYPFAAHSGFKLGFNVQEATNFADQWWIEPGLLAPTCECFPDKLCMDLKEIIAVGRPELLPLYLQDDFLGLMTAVHKNPFIQLINILPSSDLSLPKEGEKVPATNALPPGANDGQQLKNRHNDVVRRVKEAVEPKKLPGQRALLFCPHKSCDRSYEGGNGKVNRLMTHINKRHSGCLECLQLIQKKYPPRVLNAVKRIPCPVCGKLLAGSSTHVKDHIKRVHLQ